MEPVGAIVIAFGIYWGLYTIARAIRMFKADLNISKIDVIHHAKKED